MRHHGMVLIFHGLTNCISHEYLYEISSLISVYLKWVFLQPDTPLDLMHYKCFLKVRLQRY